MGTENFECTVRPPTRFKEAIPEDAVAIAISFLLRTNAKIAFAKSVFPVPPAGVQNFVRSQNTGMVNGQLHCYDQRYRSISGRVDRLDAEQLDHHHRGTDDSRHRDIADCIRRRFR